MTDKPCNPILKRDSVTESPVLGEMSPHANETTTTAMTMTPTPPPGANTPSATHTHNTCLQQSSSFSDTNNDEDYLADGCVVS